MTSVVVCGAPSRPRRLAVAPSSCSMRMVTVSASTTPACGTATQRTNPGLGTTGGASAQPARPRLISQNMACDSATSSLCPTSTGESCSGRRGPASRGLRPAVGLASADGVSRRGGRAALRSLLRPPATAVVPGAAAVRNQRSSAPPASTGHRKPDPFAADRATLKGRRLAFLVALAAPPQDSVAVLDPRVSAGDNREGDEEAPDGGADDAAHGACIGTSERRMSPVSSMDEAAIGAYAGGLTSPS